MVADSPFGEMPSTERPRPRPPRVFGEPQARADVCARPLLDIDAYDTFAAARSASPMPAFEHLRMATPEIFLALLSACTDTLSMRMPAAIVHGLLEVAFTLGLAAWPEAAFDDACACPPGDGHLAATRLARLIAAELRAMAIADSETAQRHTPGLVSNRSPDMAIATHKAAEGAVDLPSGRSCSAAPGECPGGGKNGCGSQAIRGVQLVRLPCALLLQHPVRTAHRRCCRCECAVPAFGPAALCAGCFVDCAHLLSRLVGSCAVDLRDWHLLEAGSDEAPDGARFDFLNEYGRHALAADDPLWRRAEYQTELLKHCSGRMSTHVNPRAGPLDPKLLAPHIDGVLGTGYMLRSVVGSGTEAVRSFWDIADAYAPCASGAQLIVLRGAYVGGSGPQQSICGLKFVRDRAFAASAEARLERFCVDAPYKPMELVDAVAAHGSSAEPLDVIEDRCLHALRECTRSLRARGETIAGILVEFVRATDGYALSPAFAAALAEFAKRERLLLLEDSVLLGLRCGAPFASLLYRDSELQRAIQWIAVGKLYGFSGVVQNTHADHYGGYSTDPELLNGYITCNISPLEVVRCRAILSAVVRRKLCRNAARVGRILCRHLRQAGLRCWGVGLTIWYDPTSGSVHNATVLHNRILPTLTLTEAEAREVVVRQGIFSHLPTLMNSSLGRMCDRQPPPWHDPCQVLRWHARRIAASNLPPPRPNVLRRRTVAWGVKR